MRKFLKKISPAIIVFVLLSASFSPNFSNTAKAQWVTWDPGNFVPNAITGTASWGKFLKDFALDTVAWTAANMVIERLTASTVNWINSGFQGSPAYITDPERYFLDLGDKVAGDFIMNDPRLSQLCGPISARVRIALTTNYLGERPWSCTLSQVGNNLENFMNDFSQGGWDNFFEITQKQQNNPIGAYLQAQNELNIQLASRSESAKMQLGWGTGFLSKKVCARYSERVEGKTIPGGQDILIGIDAEGNEIYGKSEEKKLPDIPPKCIEEKIVTPGSVIQDQLNNVLGIPGSKLAVADEINEIISALLNQMINRVIGGIGAGLRGASSPSSTGGGVFTDSLNNKSNAAANSSDAQSCDPTIEFCDALGQRADVSELLNTPQPDVTSGVPSNSTLVTPSDIIPIVGGNTSNRPLDPDCSTYSDSELNQMANEISSNQGITFADAYRNLDCQPR